MGWICCCTPCAVRPHYAIDAAPALFLPRNQIVSSPSGMPFVQTFRMDADASFGTFFGILSAELYFLAPCGKKGAAPGAVFTPFRHGYEKLRASVTLTPLCSVLPLLDKQTALLQPSVPVIFPIAHDVLRDKVPHKQRRIQIMFRPHPSNPSRTSNSVTIATSGRTGIINADIHTGRTPAIRSLIPIPRGPASRQTFH